MANENVALMRRWFDERALDGFNIFVGHPSQFP